MQNEWHCRWLTLATEMAETDSSGKKLIIDAYGSEGDAAVVPGGPGGTRGRRRAGVSQRNSWRGMWTLRLSTAGKIFRSTILLTWRAGGILKQRITRGSR